MLTFRFGGGFPPYELMANCCHLWANVGCLCYHCATNVLPMTPYTLRPLLWLHKKNKDGVAPLMIAVTIKRKRSYIKTPYRLKEEQWKDNEVVKHSNATIINAAIRSQISKLEHEIIARQLEGRTLTAQSLKHAPASNFFKFAEEVKNKTIADRKETNRLRTFAGDHLELTDIDQAFIRKYEAHERKRKMANNTIQTTLKWFRRVMSLAKKEGLIKTNPFDEYDMPRYIQSDRIFLSPKERDILMKAWQTGKFQGSLHTTLTYFLIGVYTGLRHSDWANVTERIEGKFLRLRAIKNKESVVIPIGKTLRKLLKVAATLPAPFSGDKTREHLKVIAGVLEINRNITTHVARHSFGAMCAELRLPKSVTAELMGINVQTVEVYYHLTGQNIIDQAAALKAV